MRSPFSATVFMIGTAVFVLAACTAQQVGDNDAVATAGDRAAGARPGPAPGGVARRGDSFAMMSQQYTPHAGPVAATGAGAWVPPAPAPAFVINTPLPPAPPPAPPPAAVANRQPAAPAASAPAAPPAVPASEVARPEAAQPAAAAAPDPAVRAAGLALFNDNGCGGCHVFADAGAGGAVGPSLDRHLAVGAIVDAVSNGQGPMPSFKGAMSDAEIETLANYIAQFSK